MAILIRQDLLDSGKLQIPGGGAAVQRGRGGRLLHLPLAWEGMIMPSGCFAVTFPQGTLPPNAPSFASSLAVCGSCLACTCGLVISTLLLMLPWTVPQALHGGRTVLWQPLLLVIALTWWMLSACGTLLPADFRLFVHGAALALTACMSLPLMPPLLLGLGSVTRALLTTEQPPWSSRRGGLSLQVGGCGGLGCTLQRTPGCARRWQPG